MNCEYPVNLDVLARKLALYVYALALCLVMDAFRRHNGFGLNDFTYFCALSTYVIFLMHGYMFITGGAPYSGPIIGRFVDNSVSAVS